MTPAKYSIIYRKRGSRARQDKALQNLDLQITYLAFLDPSFLSPFRSFSLFFVPFRSFSFLFAPFSSFSLLFSPESINLVVVQSMRSTVHVVMGGTEWNSLGAWLTGSWFQRLGWRQHGMGSVRN